MEFRWPTQADFESLDLLKPPKLVEIRTNGCSRLTKIQLVFEDGTKSPLIDSKCLSTKGLSKVYAVKDEPITQV